MAKFARGGDSCNRTTLLRNHGRNWRLAVRTIWRYRGVGRLASVSGAA